MKPRCAWSLEPRPTFGRECRFRATGFKASSLSVILRGSAEEEREKKGGVGLLLSGVFEDKSVTAMQKEKKKKKGLVE